MGLGGQGRSPSDVAVAVGIERVLAFMENPLGAAMRFAQGEIVGGNVRIILGETLLSRRKLIHQRKTKVMLSGAKVDGLKSAAKQAGRFPADLPAQTGPVSGRLDPRQVTQEKEQARLQKVPVIGSAGKQGTQPELGAFDLINIDGGQVTLAGSGDVKP
jgi:hypothetical protein